MCHELINKIVNNLIDNLPDHFKNKDNPMIIDLILDSGSFNGGYLLGALYFLHLLTFQTPIIYKLFYK
jgi:hypothetical protein